MATAAPRSNRTALTILGVVLLAVLCLLLYLGLADEPLEKRPEGKEGAALTAEQLSQADARAGFPAADDSATASLPADATGDGEPAVEVPQRPEANPYAPAETPSGD